MDESATTNFDYSAPAELFTAKRSRGPRGGLGYRHHRGLSGEQTLL